MDHKVKWRETLKKHPEMEGINIALLDNIHAIYRKKDKIIALLTCIHLQGGPCDRRVATIPERRLSLTHSTIPTDKKRIVVNPYHHYNSASFANPYHSYDIAGGKVTCCFPRQISRSRQK